MLLRSYRPEIVLPECDHDRASVNIVGYLGEDISPVFPLLNATHPDALFYAQARALCFRFEGHAVTLQPHEVLIGGLIDGDEAVETLARLQRLINDTWERRAEITPSTAERQRMNPLAVYRLLPDTNCRECGEPSCMVFANKLVTGQVRPERCLPLYREEPYRERRERLQAMVALAPRG